MDDLRFQDAIRNEVEAKRCAREVLGVGDEATPDEIKRAWRTACLKTHPDRNPGDSNAQRRFILVNCAYRLLTEGVPCDALLDDVKHKVPAPEQTGYNLDNPWGMFLWWRDKFF